jgi:ABC-type amino acid transport substrate-binding protein
MKIVRNLCLLISFLSLSIDVHSEELVKIKNISGDNEMLIESILKLALSKSDLNLQVQRSKENYSDSRLIEEVESGGLDVMWAGANQSIESRLKTVRIPVLKGLLGHRIFIIRASDQSKFEKINSLDELKQYRAGQGTFWGDTQILKSANIPTVTTLKYPNLFPMLEGGRFDYFPRAIQEPWSEVESRPELNLVIDKHIMLVYPYAMYFYVNQSNDALYEKLYSGLNKAIMDGSFDKLFFENPMIKSVLRKAHLSSRKVFRISNPLMHPDTPYDRKEYWLDVSKY